MLLQIEIEEREGVPCDLRQVHAAGAAGAVIVYVVAQQMPRERVPIAGLGILDIAPPSPFLVLLIAGLADGRDRLDGAREIVQEAAGDRRLTDVELNGTLGLPARVVLY